MVGDQLSCRETAPCSFQPLIGERGLHGGVTRQIGLYALPRLFRALGRDRPPEGPRVTADEQGLAPGIRLLKHRGSLFPQTLTPTTTNGPVVAAALAARTLLRSSHLRPNQTMSSIFLYLRQGAAATLCLVALAATARAQITTDLLADASQWRPWMSTPGAEFGVSPTAQLGSALFSSPTNAESFAAIYNDTISLPYNTSWSLGAWLQVLNPYLGNEYDLTPGAWVGIELVVSPLNASPEINRFGQRLEYGYRDDRGPQFELGSFAVADGRTFSTGSAGFKSDYAPDSPRYPWGNVRIDFDSQEKTITMFHNTYQPGIPSGWVQDGPALSLAGDGLDFGMDSSDRFAVALVGDSGGARGRGYFYDLRLTTDGAIPAGVPEPSTYGMAGIAVLAAAIFRRRFAR